MKTVDDVIDNLRVMSVEELKLLGISIFHELNDRIKVMKIREKLK